MGLSSSMWTSVSGLLAHGEKMNVVGNNIANVSTLGFKSQRMDFEDFIYQDSFSGGGPTQVGFGVGVNTIVTDFSQGSFETTNIATDLAIGGEGYFQVGDPYSDQVWYTRAGNFEFNTEGYLQLPSGEILQGWKIDNSSSPSVATGASPATTTPSVIRGTGVPTDIKLDTWTVPAKETTKVDLAVNLAAKGTIDRTQDLNNPFFSMSEVWNGHEDHIRDKPAISSDAFAYQTPIKVYDEGGTSHTLTTYFDSVSSDAITDLPAGYQVYEYMVTMDPAEDMRTFGGTLNVDTGVVTGGTSFQETEAAGILMKGTMVFNSAGELINQTAYTYMGNTTYPEATAGDTALALPSIDPTDPGAWQPTAVSDNGYPVLTANFSGHPLSNSVRQSAGGTELEDASQHLIEFDLGIKVTGNLNAPWGTVTDAAGNVVTVTPTDEATSVTGPSIGYLMDPNPIVPPATKANVNYTSLAQFTPTTVEIAGDATTRTGENPVTQNSLADGYSTGNLQTVNFDQSGVLYGIYSNGVTLPLYQITLYDFVAPQGLYREGGNLFSATLESGNPQIAAPGQGGMGTIQAYAIEQSNVDMSTEFVQMIATQRGFQANSKGITTVDEMLTTVIGMKR